MVVLNGLQVAEGKIDVVDEGANADSGEAPEAEAEEETGEEDKKTITVIVWCLRLYMHLLVGSWYAEGDYTMVCHLSLYHVWSQIHNYGDAAVGRRNIMLSFVAIWGMFEQAADVKTAPMDFRFPTTNQAKHCFTRYNEFHK